MNFYDYIDFVNALREDNISIGTSLKIKNASNCNAGYLLSSLTLSSLIAYIGGWYILGPFWKLPAAGKTFFPIAFFIFYLEFGRRF